MEEQQVRNCCFKYSQLIIFYKPGVFLDSLKYSVEDGKVSRIVRCFQEKNQQDIVISEEA